MNPREVRQRSTPTYDDLRRRTDAPAGSSWGVFGEESDLGTIARLTPEVVVRAAQLVQHGRMLNLDHPLTEFEPYPASLRQSLRHEMFSNNPDHRDDRLDNLYLQGTSQIDGLRHIGHPEHGFYNGTLGDEITAGTTRLGIAGWANHGIVARGVLLDVASYLDQAGRTLDLQRNSAISVDDLEATAEHFGVLFESGDALLIRTGWAPYYIGMDGAERDRLNSAIQCPGLEQSEAVLSWLWDHEFSLIAADNLAVECFPPLGTSPFNPPSEETGRGLSHAGTMHRPLIALLGFALGELWALDELAADCHDDGVYEFMLVSSPLYLPAAAGTPANATAIK